MLEITNPRRRAAYAGAAGGAAGAAAVARIEHTLKPKNPNIILQSLHGIRHVHNPGVCWVRNIYEKDNGEKVAEQDYFFFF